MDLAALKVETVHTKVLKTRATMLNKHLEAMKISSVILSKVDTEPEFNSIFGIMLSLSKIGKAMSPRGSL